MAELIGLLASGITLAGLFKTCLDAIDLIQTAQQQELDLKKLVLKLNIEKCRLYAWVKQWDSLHLRVQAILDLSTLAQTTKDG